MGGLAGGVILGIQEGRSCWNGEYMSIDHILGAKLGGAQSEWDCATEQL